MAAEPLEEPKTTSRDRVLDIHLDDLNPAKSKGKETSPHEAAIFNLFLEADTDNSGYLSYSEFYNVLSHLVNLEKSRAEMKRYLIAGAVFVLILVGVISGMTVAIVAAYKDAFVDDDGTGANPLMTNAGGDVVATASALVAMPMFVAPVLSREALASIKHISATITGDDSELIELELGITVAIKHNATWVEFHTPKDGLGLTVKNGIAYITQNGKVHEVCAADVSCTAFKSARSEAEQLIADAKAALQDAGHSVPTRARQLEYCASCGGAIGRRLAESAGSESDWLMAAEFLSVADMHTADARRHVGADGGEAKRRLEENAPPVEDAPPDAVRALAAEHDMDGIETCEQAEAAGMCGTEAVKHACAKTCADGEDDFFVRDRRQLKCG